MTAFPISGIVMLGIMYAQASIVDNRVPSTSFWNVYNAKYAKGPFPTEARFRCPVDTGDATPLQAIWQLARLFGTESSPLIGSLANYLVNYKEVYTYQDSRSDSHHIGELELGDRSVRSIAMLSSQKLLVDICAKLRTGSVSLYPIEVGRNNADGSGPGLKHDGATIPLPRECPWLKSAVQGLARTMTNHGDRNFDVVARPECATWAPERFEGSTHARRCESWERSTMAQAHIGPANESRHVSPKQASEVVRTMDKFDAVFRFHRPPGDSAAYNPAGAYLWEWLPVEQSRRLLASAVGRSKAADVTVPQLARLLTELCDQQARLEGASASSRATSGSASRLDPAACVLMEAALMRMPLPDGASLPISHAVRVLPASTRGIHGVTSASDPLEWSVARPMQHAARAVASGCLGRVVHPDDVVLGKRPGTQAHVEDGRASDSTTGIPALRLVEAKGGNAAQQDTILTHGIAGKQHATHGSQLGSDFSAATQIAGRTGALVIEPALRTQDYPQLPAQYGIRPELQVHVPGSLSTDELTPQYRCLQAAHVMWDGPDLETIQLLRSGLANGGDSDEPMALVPRIVQSARAFATTGWRGLSPDCKRFQGQWRGPEWLDGTDGKPNFLAQLQTGAVLDPRQMVDACLEDGKAAFDRLKASMGSSDLDELDVTPLSMARSLCFWMDSCTPGKDPGCLRGFHPRPMPFLSQQVMQQDLWVVQVAMQGKRGGFFIEAGAVDGRMLSTTWALEKGFGWRGLLVEARGEELEAMRVRRPRSTCVYAALGARDGGFLEMSASGDDPTGMMAVTSQVDTSGLDQSGWQGRGRAPIRRLSSILDEMGAPSRIDFLTLDIEGGELEVLESFPFDRYSFGAMAIETNNEEPRRSRIRGVLASHGYVYAGGLGLDDAYLHPEVAADVLGSLEDYARARRGRGRRVAFGGRDIGT